MFDVNLCCTVDELFAAARVQRSRREVQWLLSQSRLFVPRSVLVSGVRGTHVPREPARHRTCLRLGTEALSRWVSRQGLAEHVGRCQSRARLANLCRLGQVLIRRARSSTPTSRSASSWWNRLRARFDDHRLVLELFPWAKFRRRKGAIKLHTLLDLRGAIPCFIHISHGKMHDVNVLDHLPIEPGAFYVIERGCVDFQRLYRFTLAAAFFVTRSKNSLDCTRRTRRKVDKASGLRSDRTIVLAGPKSSRAYPVPLRRIAFYDTEHRRRLVFLTNNFTLPALTVKELYKCRWQVELFFKWIKQHLRIKAFYGTTDNAVKTQVWIAISVYVLVAIVKKELRIERSLSDILQVLSLTLFKKSRCLRLLTTKTDRFQKPLILTN